MPPSPPLVRPSERSPAGALQAGASVAAPGATPGAARRTIVLVGLMGVGKTTIGRGVATALALPFRDADEEVERAAARSVAEIFAERGESEFRDGERRVIARLLTCEPPHVLAFGGGAFLDARTRALTATHAVSVWLRADLEVLARRVARKASRPLLVGRDPLEVLRAHAEVRHPIYAEADLTVDAGEGPSGATVAAVLRALDAHFATRPQ